MNNEVIRNLLEALEYSAENVPLRLQVADMMMEEKLYEEASAQYQEVLNRNYGNARATSGLASSFYYQKKYSAAIVVYEQLQGTLTRDDSTLYIKCLIQENSIPQAIEVYQQLLSGYPDFSDEEIDKSLRNSAHDDLDDLFGDRVQRVS